MTEFPPQKGGTGRPFFNTKTRRRWKTAAGEHPIRGMGAQASRGRFEKFAQNPPPQKKNGGPVLLKTGPESPRDDQKPETTQF